MQCSPGYTVKLKHLQKVIFFVSKKRNLENTHLSTHLYIRKRRQGKIETNEIDKENKRNGQKLHYFLYNSDLWNHAKASYTQENKDGKGGGTRK